MLLLLLACASEDPADTGDTVTLTYAVATDIDETLTTNDGEYIKQWTDASYDPEMRPDANTLMQAYDDACYRIVYVTARGEEVTLPDGRTAYEATSDWLDLHAFPRSEGDLFLAEGGGAIGSAAVPYKTGVLEGVQGEGTEFVWAYGNADSDIEAFQGVGIPDDHIFLVGVRAGEMGVVGVTDDDAYTAHLAEQAPPAGERCDGGG